MEVLFEYAAADYRSIIYTERPKLCREVEHHLSKAGVSTEPEVVVLSYTLSERQQRSRHDGNTQFFCNGLIRIGSAT